MKKFGLLIPKYIFFQYQYVLLTKFGPLILKYKFVLCVYLLLTLLIRHVTIVPFGNKAFYWLSGTKNLSAANRKAVSIHVTTPAICIKERFFSHTADNRHLKGGRGEILHRKFSTCI
jgi:hypothetical protein